MEDLDLLGVDASEADAIEARAKKVSATVSPWLWILSIGGFVSAMINRHQIHQMYGNWKNMKRALSRSN